MVSFACKTVDIKDIVMCSFDLNKTEYDLLTHFLSTSQEQTITEISKNVKLERSTVQKGIASLLTKQLLRRRQINISSGGYRYVYALINKEQLKKELSSIVSSWHGNVQHAISEW